MNYEDENHRIYSEFKPDDYTSDHSENLIGFFKEIYKLRNSRLIALSKGKKVLDVGCGSGAYFINLLNHGVDVYGLDYVKQFVDKTISLIPKEDAFRVKFADARKMSSSYDHESFDFIYSVSSIPYMKDWRDVLSESKILLKKNGIVFLEFGNPNSMAFIKSKLSGTGLKLFDEPRQVVFDEFKKNGMKIITVRMSQMFPMYMKNEDEPCDQLCSAFLRAYMAKGVGDEEILDESVAYSCVMSKYAYRMTVVAIRDDSGSIGDYEPSCQHGDPAKWPSNNMEFDFDSMIKDPRVNVGRICQCLIVDPTDCVAVYAIMRLHGKAYVDLAEKFLEDVKKEYGSSVGPRIKGMANQKESVAHFDMEWKGVSVVLPVYNNAHMIHQILVSLNRQILKEFELVVVNDGSKDGTAMFLDGLKMRDGISLKKVVHHENRKLPGALNSGFQKTTGNYLTWVSSDCICHPNMLLKLASALNSCPEAGMVYSPFFIVDHEGRIINKIAGQRLNLRSLIIRNEGNASFMYTRKAAIKTGIYDERLNGAEDWDYWLRIASEFPFAYIEDCLYYYRSHDGSMQSTIRAEIDENAEKTIEKLFRSIGNRIDIRVLYPSIGMIEDGVELKKIIAEAQIDFGTRCISARTNIARNISMMFLDEAIKSSDDVNQKFKAMANKVVLLVSHYNDNSNALKTAEEALGMSSQVNTHMLYRNENYDRYISSLKKFIETKNPESLNSIFPLWTSEDERLFRYDGIMLIKE